MKVLCSVFLCGLATCLSAGCGSDASVRPPGESVSGKITWEGQPLASGEVELTPSSGAAATVPVLDGAYQTKAGVGVDAGATTLRISVHGAAMDAGGADVPEEERGVMDVIGIAVKSVNVPEGGGSFDFDLTKSDLGE